MFTAERNWQCEVGHARPSGILWGLPTAIVIEDRRLAQQGGQTRVRGHGATEHCPESLPLLFGQPKQTPIGEHIFRAPCGSVEDEGTQRPQNVDLDPF